MLKLEITYWKNIIRIYDAAEESLNIKDREFMKMFAQKFDLGETLINNNMGKAFWEDSGEVIG